MSETQPYHSRKRKLLQRPPTTQKSHPSERLPEIQKQFPAAFWDNLSKIELTKRAIEELDRRNSTPAAPSAQPLSKSDRLPRRPITWRVLAEQERKSQEIIPPTEYLSYCGSRGLKNIQRFARHGGPDLLDLRSVCLLNTC